MFSLNYAVHLKAQWNQKSFSNDNYELIFQLFSNIFKWDFQLN